MRADGGQLPRILHESSARANVPAPAAVRRMTVCLHSPGCVETLHRLPRHPTKGTAEENKAAISGIVSHFGTYTVDEPGKTLVFHVEGSAYPNWDQTQQRETIMALNPNDVLT
jgi:hypothetical protein